MSIEKMIKSKQLSNVSSELINKADEIPFNNAETKLNEKKTQILGKIRDRLIENYSIESISTAQKFKFVRNAAWTMIEEEAENSVSGLYIDSYDKAELLEMLIQSMFGYGVLDPLINDPAITEIMVNGKDIIFVEKKGTIQYAVNKKGERLKFNNIEELIYIIEKIVSPINRKVDESNPIVDARLPNGFRVNIVLNPISLEGPIITIRKFPENPFTMNDLVAFGMLPEKVAGFLKLLVRSRYNIIVSGGTGTGKTTFLNALSNYIDENSRIITIEDAAELKLSKLKNLIRLETRPPNIEGKGQIIMRDLVRTALRMRPDRIIVGEVRGGEALDMLQAMNTGHDGSLSTVHANSAHDMLTRLETMVLMSGVELPLSSVRQQIASAVEIIIHLGRMQNGSRKVVQITEVIGINNMEYISNDLFTFNKSIEDNGKIGILEYSGNTMVRTGKFFFSQIKESEVKRFINI